MNTIENEGFLSLEADEGKSQIILKYKEAFLFSKELNQYSMSMLRSLKINWDNNHELVINTLFLRIIETFQAVILLLERGMMSQSKILVRAILEMLFILVSLQKKPHLLKCYKDQHEDNHKRILKSFLKFKNKHLKASVKKYKLQDLYKKKKKELSNKELELLSPIKWAEESELEDFYNLYYVTYCNSTHSNLVSLNDHIDENSEEKKLAFGPSDKDLYDVLAANCEVLINAIISTAKVYGKDIEKEINGFVNNLSDLNKKFKDETKLTIG